MLLDHSSPRRRRRRHRSFAITRFALGAATFFFAFTVVLFSFNDWRSPQPPHFSVVLGVFGNYLAALIIGVPSDLLRSRITSRWRAGLLGAVMWPLYGIVLYATLLAGIVEGFAVKHHLFVTAGNVVLGFVGGVVLYDPEFADWHD